MVPGRDPVAVPEWGDQLTARYIQEQNNAVAKDQSLSGVAPALRYDQPPTAPEGHFSDSRDIGPTLVHIQRDETLTARHPSKKLSGGRLEQGDYAVCAHDGLPLARPQLHRLRTGAALIRTVEHAAFIGTHFLIALMRPDTGTRWRQRRPLAVCGPQEAAVDNVDKWVTLDRDVPSRPPTPINIETQEPEGITQQDTDNVLPCEVSLDVDSVLVLCDSLPLSVTLEVPFPKNAIMYSNKLCLPAGPARNPILLSRIPNFKLGRGGRLSVHVFFPDAYDPDFKGMGSSRIDDSVLRLLWDTAIQPAIIAVFPDGAYNSLPLSQQYETAGKSRRQIYTLVEDD
jgi:hypothetical protein